MEKLVTELDIDLPIIPNGIVFMIACMCEVLPVSFHLSSSYRVHFFKAPFPRQRKTWLPVYTRTPFAFLENGL